MKNIVLIGFMGCGKTSVGTRMSYRLRLPMIDTDKEIERKSRSTVSAIFESLGEDAFREMETECLKQLLEKSEDRIISVGGGLPLRSENRELMKKLGTVVFLRVTAETVCERLAGDTTRPLLQGEHPREKVALLLAQRTAVYEAAADIIVDADGKEFDTIIEEIMMKVEEAER